MITKDELIFLNDLKRNQTTFEIKLNTYCLRKDKDNHIKYKLQ